MALCRPSPANLRGALRRAFATLWLIPLALVYLLPGVVGHDPWKQDEAYTFGLVLHILETGDWIVPTLAGQPFMEKPPFFYASAAILASMLAPWLPLHDGARLGKV